MGKIKALIYCVLFAVTPSLFAHKECPFPVPFDSQTVSQTGELQYFELGKNQRQKWFPKPTTYDELIQMFEKLESGKFKEEYSLKELKSIIEQIVMYASEGIPPNAFEKDRELDDDLWGVLGQDMYYLANGVTYRIEGDFEVVWGNFKKFCKKYRNEILIGGAIDIALEGAANIAVRMIHSASEKDPLTDAIKEAGFSFTESLADDNLFEPPPCESRLSVEETARVIGSIFGHKSLDSFHHELRELLPLEFESQAEQPHLDSDHHEIDRIFSTNFSLLFSGLDNTAKLNALAYRARAEAAFQLGHYSQHLHNLNRAIQIDPTHSDTYLDRGTAYFEMGQYDKSIEDFNRFTAQQNSATSQICEKFTLSFAKAVPIGIYESGKGLFLFAKDLIIHPIHTATQMYDALSTLAKLAIIDHQWEEVGKILSPEIHKLVTEWETLSSDQRGKLAGNAFGKLGADIFVPGATAKIASRSLKGAKELSSALKNVKKAEKTYVLETAASMKNSAKIAEAVSSADLSLTARLVKGIDQANRAGEVVKTLPGGLTRPKLIKGGKSFDRGELVKAGRGMAKYTAPH